MAGLTLALAMLAAPESAVGPVEKLREVVVEAIRDCPKGAPDEIVVCSRDRGMAEGFRLPRLDPRYARRDVRGRSVDSRAGAARASGDCSASGSAGATGCSLDAANDWGAWKKEAQREGDAWFPW
ncbi:hypothetical protein ABC347_14075 [Sphingomonas sp. 1P06PA]|uniref:hypothetical protein n=1 Tax=Sphingomonas sp. 1P06PA TaxID=554121 RepID=UPI0039A51D1F